MERSYNGWTASTKIADIGGLDNRPVGGVKMAPGVRRGDVSTVLFYVAEQFHRRVEALVPGWCWGFSYRTNRNANNLSCHASATAIDLNAPRHPNGKRGTFTKAQVAEIRAIQAEVQKVVRWGGDFSGTPDEMHFEIVASPATVAMVAARLSGSSAVGSPITTLPTAPAPAQEVEDDMFSETRDRATIENTAYLVGQIKEQTDRLYDEDVQTDQIVWGLLDPESGLRVQVASLQGQLAALTTAVQQLGLGGGGLDMAVLSDVADRAASKAAAEALGGLADKLRPAV